MPDRCMNETHHGYGDTAQAVPKTASAGWKIIEGLVVVPTGTRNNGSDCSQITTENEPFIP